MGSESCPEARTLFLKALILLFLNKITQTWPGYSSFPQFLHLEVTKFLELWATCWAFLAFLKVFRKTWSFKLSSDAPESDPDELDSPVLKIFSFRARS